MPEYNLEEFKKFIAARESGGNYRPVQGKSNPSMSGKYQFNWGLHGDWIKRVTGVKSREQFLANPQAQETAMKYHTENDLYPNAKKYYTKVKALHPELTLENVMALGHHQGWGNLEAGLKAGNVLNFKDGAGTSSRQYLNKEFESMRVPNKNAKMLYSLNGKHTMPVRDIPEWFSTDASGVRDWRSMSVASTEKTSMTGIPMQNPNSSGRVDLTAYEDTPTKKANFQTVGKVTSSLVPYLSNLYNSTLKPAAVPRPVFNSPVKLQRVNMDADRTAVNNAYRAAIGNADQTLDGNTAVPVKLFAKGMKLNQLSQVNQAERNQNLQISNQEVLTNAQIAKDNNSALYQTRLLEAERTNAIQAAKSANMANAADKFMMQQNAQAAVDLENEKIQLLVDSDQYGTWKRFQEKKNQKKYGGIITSGVVFKKIK